MFILFILSHIYDKYSCNQKNYHWAKTIELESFGGKFYLWDIK